VRERERDGGRGDLEPRGDRDRAERERLGDRVRERSRGLGERVRDRERSIGDGERDGMLANLASDEINICRVLQKGCSLICQDLGPKTVKVDVFL
jgi:hypothetical protein